MYEKYIIEFLKNKKNNLEDLLKLICKITDSKFYNLVYNDNTISNNSNKFKDIKLGDNSVYINDNIVNFKNDTFTLTLLHSEPNKYKKNILELLDVFLNLLKIMIPNNNNDNEMFIANMSHEIRTPLNGVVGYTQLLGNNSLSLQMQQSYIKSLTECSTQLMQIINDILDLSRLNHKNVELNNECFSINELVESVKNITIQKIKNKGQTITFKFLNKIPDYIISDKHKIIQILVNLISNANKYINKGCKINVEIKDSSDDNNLIFTISDNGNGIKEDNISKLFKPFKQVCVNKNKGHGLGLVICKKLCKLLEGDIYCKSCIINKKTDFVFNIKYKNHSEIYNIYNEKNELLLNKNVLFFSECLSTRLFISDILIKWGMKYNTFCTIKEILYTIENNHYIFDLCIIDISLIKDDLNTVYMYLNNIKKLLPIVPIIIFSSVDQNISLNIIDNILPKPINEIHLYDKIYKTLKKSQDKEIIISNDINVTNNNSNNNCKILIAEDNEYNSDLLLNVIKSYGYKNVKCVEDGKKAITEIEESILIQKPYGILLLDIRMPIMNGYQVIEYIKSRNWDLPRIIIVSASLLKNERSKCEELGVNYFINKPFDIKQLQRVISKLNI